MKGQRGDWVLWAGITLFTAALAMHDWLMARTFLHFIGLVGWIAVVWAVGTILWWCLEEQIEDALWRFDAWQLQRAMNSRRRTFGWRDYREGRTVADQLDRPHPFDREFCGPDCVPVNGIPQQQRQHRYVGSITPQGDTPQ